MVNRTPADQARPRRTQAYWVPELASSGFHPWTTKPIFVQLGCGYSVIHTLAGNCHATLLTEHAKCKTGQKHQKHVTHHSVSKNTQNSQAVLSQVLIQNSLCILQVASRLPRVTASVKILPPNKILPLPPDPPMLEDPLYFILYIPLWLNHRHLQPA